MVIYLFHILLLIFGTDWFSVALPLFFGVVLKIFYLAFGMAENNGKLESSFPFCGKTKDQFMKIQKLYPLKEPKIKEIQKILLCTSQIKKPLKT